MKRFFIIGLLFATIVTIQSQEKLNTKESQYYLIEHPFTIEEGDYLAKKMDAFFDFFNEYFHFNKGDIKSKLNVKLFPNQSSYSNYILDITESSSSFVFIQYHSVEKSELIGFVNPEEDFNETLIHYSFIQYLRTFIKNPPLWLEKGFAVYFEKCKYRENRSEIYYKENLTWLN